jgi:hypothetical protein
LGHVFQILRGRVHLVVENCRREFAHFLDILANPITSVAKVNVTILYYSDVPPQPLDLRETTGYDGDDVISAKPGCTFNERGSIRCVLDENGGRGASGESPKRMPQFVKSALGAELIPQQMIPSS